MFRYAYGLILAAVVLFLACATPITSAAAHEFWHHHHFRHARMSVRPSGIVNIVTAAARRHGVPIAFQLAIIETESGFNPSARNGRSLGLGQIQPPTAHDAGCRGSLMNAAINADCSARILAVLLRDAGGDWRRAAAHYNQGRYARGSAGASYARLVLSRARRHATASRIVVFTMLA